MNEQQHENLIKAGTACFLVKDERLRQGYACPIFDWLKQEGFKSWGRKGNFSAPWILINPNSKTYAPGWPGVCIAAPVGGHAITWDEFITVYSIYRKYAGLSPLAMPQEQAH